MKRERQVHLFQQGVGLHVRIVVHRAVARGRDHEADHTLGLAKFLHRPERGLRVVKRQI
jgi:hypothetical protein